MAFEDAFGGWFGLRDANKKPRTFKTGSTPLDKLMNKPSPKRPSSTMKNTDRFAVKRVQRPVQNTQRFVPSPNRVDRLTQPDTYRGNPTANTAPMIDPMESRIQSILDALDDSYQMPTIPGGEDFGKGEMLAALNQALGNQIQGINSARNTTNSNFQESDRNVADMHAALQGNIRTEGAQNFRGIADSLVNSLNQNKTGAVNELNQMEAKDRADRIAMLKNLGIEASGASPESTVYDETAADITSRANIGTNLARQDLGTNLTYNEGMAQTAGMQGASRRAALNRQLQAIMGQLSSKESDVRSRHAEQVAAAESEAANRRMQWEMQNNQMGYDQWQNQQGNLRDMLGMLYENQNKGVDREEDRRRWEAEMAMQERENAMRFAPEPAKPPRLTGAPGAINNLVNAGYNPVQLQAGQRAVQEAMAEGMFDRNTNISDRINYLIDEKGIDSDVAVALVQAYSSL